MKIDDTGTNGAMATSIETPGSSFRHIRISCDPCRKRKLRCNRVKPCSSCTKRNIKEECYKNDTQEPTSSSNLKRFRREHVFEAEEDERRRKLTNSLAKCKEQIEAMSKLAEQSAHSIDVSMRVLSEINLVGSSRALSLGVSIPATNGLVRWQDVREHLPEIEVCNELVTFYLEDLAVYMRLSQRNQIDNDWRLLVEGPGLKRTEAAIIFTVFALADVMVPTSSLKSSRHSLEDHHRWIMLLGDPISSTSASLDAFVDNSFPKIQQLAMISIYHLYTGRADRLWESIGFAMRKAIAFGLFDERTSSWTGLDNVQKEYRRRLAWYMLTLERCQALARELPFALHPSYVYLAEASFEPDSILMKNKTPAIIVPNTPAILSDGRLQNRISASKPGIVKFVQVEILGWCQDYLMNFVTMEPSVRYSRALLLDDALNRVLIEGLHNSGIEHHELQTLSTSMFDGCHKDRQVEMTHWVSSIFFLRCLVTRRFLLDENAPPNLRYVSLVYAHGILATIPTLTRLVKQGQVPLQTTWHAIHLLAAAITFTVVILGQDDLLDAHANAQLFTASSTAVKNTLPTEQMDWLADNILDTLECLETLVQSGNHQGRVGQQLLEKLCGTHGDLRRMYRLRFNRIAALEGDVEFRQQHGAHFNQGPPDGHAASNHLLNNIDGPFQSEHHSTYYTNQGLSPLNSSLVDSITNRTTFDAFSSIQPVSALSLLDAVLMDPPVADFMGNANHSDLLAYLLQDSPDQ